MTTWHALSASRWRRALDRQRGFGLTPLHFRRAPPHPWQGDGQCWVGAAEIDITPPPGIPKGGHSAMSTLGTGMRTRLKARAFYLKDGRGSALMILQADLHAGSALLREAVAEAISPLTDVDQHAVCMSCTHTHSGPGQLLESNFYNDHASHKPGFDPVLFAWMRERLIEAALAAYRDRRPGRIGAGRRDVYGIARQRAWLPHRNNTTVATPDDDEAARFREINPWMYMLRLDARNENGEYQPLAAWTSYSVHGTAVSRREPLYNADLWAYLQRGLADRVQSAGSMAWSFVHGACQGTHGDINPAITPGRAGFPEARRVGTRLADEAWTLFESLGPAMRDDLTLAAGLRHIDCYRDSSIGDTTLAERPAVSHAQVAGAYENSTPVLYHVPLFAHGRGSARRRPHPQHGHKRRLAGPLQPLLMEKGEFPHQVLFQTLRIGDAWWLAAPFEITTEAGRRIRAAAQTALQAGEIVCVTSLANGYTGYCATPEEYALQHYEGGSTLYGPNTTDFLAQHLAQLAVEVSVRESVFDGPAHWHFEMKSRRYFPHRGHRHVLRAEVKAPTAFHDKRMGEHGWAFRWRDQDPVTQAFHEPMVSIETECEGVWRTLAINNHCIDDSHDDISIALVSDDGRHGTRYEARWYIDTPPPGRYRFRIAPRANAGVLVSTPFRV